jgi:hypothetical protein
VHMSILDLITSLDVEKKAQVKDGQSKGDEGQTSANMVYQPRSYDKGKDKANQNQNNNKPKQTTTFKIIIIIVIIIIIIIIRRRRMRATSCAGLWIIG